MDYNEKIKKLYDAACRDVLSEQGETWRVLLQPLDFQPVWHGVCEIRLWQNPKGLFHLGMCKSHAEDGIQHYQLPYDGKEHHWAGKS